MERKELALFAPRRLDLKNPKPKTFALKKPKTQKPLDLKKPKTQKPLA
jgi:hypothetical protein